MDVHLHIDTLTVNQLLQLLVVIVFELLHRFRVPVPPQVDLSAHREQYSTFNCTEPCFVCGAVCDKHTPGHRRHACHRHWHQR